MAEPVISLFLDPIFHRRRQRCKPVGHRSLMKIKQRKNYIHLVVTNVPLFSTLETLQEMGAARRERERGDWMENVADGFALVSFSFSLLHQRPGKVCTRVIALFFLRGFRFFFVFPPLIISRVPPGVGKITRALFSGALDFKSNRPYRADFPRVSDILLDQFIAV